MSVHLVEVYEQSQVCIIKNRGMGVLIVRDHVALIYTQFYRAILPNTEEPL